MFTKRTDIETGSLKVNANINNTLILTQTKVVYLCYVIKGFTPNHSPGTTTLFLEKHDSLRRATVDLNLRVQG